MNDFHLFIGQQFKVIPFLYKINPDKIAIQLAMNTGCWFQACLE